MQQEIEKLINDENGDNEVKLYGKIKLSVDRSVGFTIGKLCVKGIINVTRSNVVIDGSDAQIDVDISDCTTSDWSLFFVHPQASNVRFKNMTVRVHIANPINSTRMFSVIYNTSYGLNISNCHINVISEKQLTMVGVYNNGNLDTHMDTRADNFVLENSYVSVKCTSEEYEKDCAVYGVYNNLANSISVQNSFIYATNKGNGERQTAVGIYTNGRFGRFVGNNIKANGMHNKGIEKEQAYAYGIINEGLYSVITSNNIIAEWAGRSVGLENKGEYAIMECNKILATHTICGRSIRNFADKCNIQGNVLTSTSRNVRLIEYNASSGIISKNIMEVLMVQSECVSGCGIYAVGEHCVDNIISENIIRSVRDCGIFADKDVGTVVNNKVILYPETIVLAGRENVQLLNLLDERHVSTLHIKEA